MSLSARELSKLKQIVKLASDLISRAEAAPPVGKASKTSAEKRIRRTGKELAAFRKMLKAERKRGVAVAELAQQHGISTAYIYSL
jgi:hypothetical protein